MSGAGFLPEPPTTDAAQKLFDEDTEELGFVMNASRLWAYQPETVEALFGVMSKAVSGQGLSPRQRGILVTAAAATLGDSYCSLAWGGKLAKAAEDPALPAAVLSGHDAGLDQQERALAAWARKVVRDPNATTADDVQELRDAGFDDARIFAITTFVALRLAFSTINDALGARPDAELRDSLPAEVTASVTYGRPVADVAL